MIKLTDLLQEQDSFTATSKKSGETVVFKSKDARDSALKAGTHSKIKDSEDGDDKKDTPKESLKSFKEVAEKNGLWDNIHKKRARIKAGSGEKMRKPGSKGAPSADDFKSASKED